MANRTTMTALKKVAFIEQLRRNPSVTAACIALKIGRDTVYRHKHKDKHFSADWDAALPIGVDALEDEVIDRAFDRSDKASHLLLMFYLKGRRKEIYAEHLKADLNHQGLVVD